jgi:hypothetical protein
MHIFFEFIPHLQNNRVELMLIVEDWAYLPAKVRVV